MPSNNPISNKATLRRSLKWLMIFYWRFVSWLKQIQSLHCFAHFSSLRFYIGKFSSVIEHNGIGPAGQNSHCIGDFILQDFTLFWWFFLARFYIGTFLMVIERNSFGPARQSSHCIGDFILQDFTLAHFQWWLNKLALVHLNKPCISVVFKIFLLLFLITQVCCCCYYVN